MAGVVVGNEGLVVTSIAVVDDDASCAALMADALELEGYQILMYYQADGTYPLLRDLQPDLIILDVYLEKRDSGWHLVDLLQMDPLTRTIPVIVATADTAQLRERDLWLRDRRIGVLAKPFDLAALYEMVGATLRGKEAVTT